MKIDVRFHKNLTEEDINNWAQYYWERGETLEEITISREGYQHLIEEQARVINNQGKSITDFRTKGGKFLKRLIGVPKPRTVQIYESYCGTIGIVIDK